MTPPRAQPDVRLPAGTLRGFGVELRRLREDELELVRQHRNSPAIREKMVYREHITEAMQRRWYASIDNAQNYYFVIRHGAEPVGLYNVKDVDWTRGVGEGGIFLWADREPMVAFAAALVGTDWIFGELGLKMIEARVLSTNSRAIRFNQALGYVFRPGVVGGELVMGSLTFADYQLATASVRALLSRRSTRQ